MTRHLLVPGKAVPLPEHWMCRWARDRPGYRWAPYPPGPPFVLADRVAALHAEITADDEPAVLIAHSGGCLAAVAWAVRHTGPVAGALLVAPPDVLLVAPPDVDREGWAPPRDRLPFQTIVVASRSDPHATYAWTRERAADWGADLVDAGDAGHINTASGYGPWPGGEELIARLDRLVAD